MESDETLKKKKKRLVFLGAKKFFKLNQKSQVRKSLAA
jgi:hypothetical protein